MHSHTERQKKMKYGGRWGVCKTRTGYLWMADADAYGKMRIQKNAHTKNNKT